jgi:hypothetical protein
MLPIEEALRYPNNQDVPQILEAAKKKSRCPSSKFQKCVAGIIATSGKVERTLTRL